MTVYPHSVRSLSEAVWTHFRVRPSDGRITKWVLDIAGPFCCLTPNWWSLRIDDKVSALLALPVEVRARNENVIYVQVRVDQETKDRLIKIEYKAAIATKDKAA